MIPLDPKLDEFKYVHVEEDGTVRELDKDEIEYLNTQFPPTDGARPYIKSNYNQLTPDKKIHGFILRKKVPKNIKIQDFAERHIKMKSPISIYASSKIIQLTPGIYSVKVLGGWSVKVGEFSFLLIDIKTGKIIKPKGTQWRIQSFDSKKRAKKIFSIDIGKTGDYRIEFKNQKDLRVRRSNLILTQLFEKTIPNYSLEICIG